MLKFYSQIRNKFFISRQSTIILRLNSLMKQEMLWLSWEDQGIHPSAHRNRSSQSLHCVWPPLVSTQAGPVAQFLLSTRCTQAKQEEYSAALGQASALVPSGHLPSLAPTGQRPSSRMQRCPGRTSASPAYHLAMDSKLSSHWTRMWWNETQNTAAIQSTHDTIIIVQHVLLECADLVENRNNLRRDLCIFTFSKCNSGIDFWLPEETWCALRDNCLLGVIFVINMLEEIWFNILCAVFHGLKNRLNFFFGAGVIFWSWLDWKHQL